MSKEESTPYSFKGDNAKLVDSIKSLLALDSKGALVPNGVCGLARQLLESAAERLTVERQDDPVGWFTDDHVDDKSATTYTLAVAERWRSKGWPVTPLFTRSDAGEVERLNTVVEQQASLIASLRADLRDSYSIDAAVQEEHLDLDAAAKKLAACMDYPWEHMPEQGRASMREHAQAVIGAALGSKQ
jgi:hypothetical protein